MVWLGASTSCPRSWAPRPPGIRVAVSAKLVRVEEMRHFRATLVEQAAAGTSEMVPAVEELAAQAGLKTAVLVEGVSDQVAIETLVARRDRNLDAEGICLVPIGGATSVGRFLGILGPHGLNARLAGLCDAAEERYFRRGLERAGLGADLGPADLEPLGFFACVEDLEDELIRALGPEAVEHVIDAQGDLKSFRTFQNQPAQRQRTIGEQLHRFMGTISGRKAQYARALIDAVDLDRVPRPLDRLLAYL